MRRVLKYGGMALVMTAVMTTVSLAQFNLFGNPLIGKQAAEFTLKDLDGQEWTLSQIREGRPAILFFWATWCPHCRTQLSALNQQIEEIHKKGIEVILIDLEEGPKQVKAFMDRNGLELNVLVDTDGRTTDDYVIPGVPTFYFIGADGKIRTVEHHLPDDYEKLLN
ncbi:MAG TPA: TlpA disulfide reductase family protein [Candidatus Omnitrophota bacterium]|jgi:peroxiredoxin|nr:TlpA disulfide reductase family protein [Candidatus Omnitrophota bacterium]